MTKTRVAAAAAAAVAVLGLGVGAAGTANATPPFHCQNGGGNQPPGQQDTCNGNGLEVVNPGGNAPGGFNK